MELVIETTPSFFDFISLVIIPLLITLINYQDKNKKKYNIIPVFCIKNKELKELGFIIKYNYGVYSEIVILEECQKKKNRFTIL